MGPDTWPRVSGKSPAMPESSSTLPMKVKQGMARALLTDHRRLRAPGLCRHNLRATTRRLQRDPAFGAEVRIGRQDKARLAAEKRDARITVGHNQARSG